MKNDRATTSAVGDRTRESEELKMERVGQGESINKRDLVNGLSVQLTRCRVDQHSSRVRSLMLPIPPPPPAPTAPPSPAAEARDYQAR